jgi:hypothetical protein
MLKKSIKVKGAESPQHMALAFRAVEDFRKSGFGKYVGEDGNSAAMLITFGTKSLFRKKPTHNIFVYESPNEYVVEISPYVKEGKWNTNSELGL